MAALVFARNYGKRDVTALYVNHNSGKFATKSESWVRSYCEANSIPFKSVSIATVLKSEWGKEAEWSRARAEIYNSMDAPVVVAHTLDDACEWWMMRAIRGKDPNLIPVQNKNVIRPFLLWEKADMKQFLLKRKIAWLDDPTNFDGSNFRSRVRTSLMPVLFELGDLKPAIARRYLDAIGNPNITTGD